MNHKRSKTSKATKATPRQNSAETIRQLKVNVGTLWQLAAMSAAHIAATKRMLVSIVAKLDDRPVAEVTAELEALADEEHDGMILNLGDKRPAAAEFLQQIREKQPGDPIGGGA